MPRYSASRNQYVQAGPGTEGGAAIYAANGAIAIADGVHALTKTSIGAFTLAVPAAADDGMRIVIVSRTAFAHVVTVAGGLGGNAADDLITFAKVGDAVELLADNQRWIPLGAPYGAVIS